MVLPGNSVPVAPSERYSDWARRKDQIDVPKMPKASVGYVMPPPGVQIECSTCAHFREPDSCEVVGNAGAIIHPKGCCNSWEVEGARFATADDPNAGIADGREASDFEYDLPSEAEEEEFDTESEDGDSDDEED